MGASIADVVKPALVEISIYPDKKVEVVKLSMTGQEKGDILIHVIS
jgi:hypothetical protein